MKPIRFFIAKDTFSFDCEGTHVPIRLYELNKKDIRLFNFTFSIHQFMATFNKQTFSVMERWLNRNYV